MILFKVRYRIDYFDFYIFTDFWVTDDKLTYKALKKFRYDIYYHQFECEWFESFERFEISEEFAKEILKYGMARLII